MNDFLILLPNIVYSFVNNRIINNERKIKLKYTEKVHQNKNKLGAGFYIVIAVCLLIIGGASWFALSNYEENQLNSSDLSENSQSYYNGNESYIETTPSNPYDTPPAESVAEPVENVEKETENSSSYISSKEETEENSLGFQYTMPVEGEFLKLPSETQLQYSATYGDMRLHKGVDISCDEGSPINACADGTILSIEENSLLGTTVTIDHSAGVTVKYSAVNNPKFKVGDKVKMGDIIGTSTTIPSECKDQSHIHIEILQNGKYVDLSAFGLN